MEVPTDNLAASSATWIVIRDKPDFVSPNLQISGKIICHAQHWLLAIDFLPDSCNIPRSLPNR
jgi:hypothetical protein